MILRRLGGFLFEIIQIVVFAVSIFLFVYLLVLQPHKIKGESMEPNFHDSEYLLTDKLSYRYNEAKYGDVIVFKAPPDYKEEYIKRIIALPGDTIAIKDSKVYVNGNILNESYIPNEFTTYAGNFLAEGSVLTVPPDSFFVMGDNREHSLDSRRFGFITKDKVIGKAWFIYWPPDEVGRVIPL